MGRPLNLHKFGDDRSLVTRDQIAVQAYINGGVNTCYLTQQKKNNAFHVVIASGAVDPATGKPYTTICTFVNSASPVAGQMSCQATTHSGTPANFYVSRITNRFVWDFTSNGPTGTGDDSNQTGKKYYWGFVDKAPESLLDAPAYDFAVLPSASRPADVNEAP